MDITLSKCQGSMVRSKKATKSKCCVIVVQHMFYGSIGTQNSIVTFMFKFDPRKGKLQIKLGQIRSNFEIQYFLTKICLSCAVLSQDSNKCYLFLCRTTRNARNYIKKCDVVTFTFFGGLLHSQKQRHCFEVLYACCLYVLLSYIFRLSDKLKNWFYRQLFLKNRNFEFWGSK